MSDKKALVLIVDDIRTNVEFISDIITTIDNTDVHGVNNGPAALNFIENNKPDLILLDISMPGMDGFEVCKRLKEDPDTADIPIIFLTARVQKEDIIKGFDVGAIDYIAKPFNLSELQSRVKTHLELRQKTIELQEINSILEQKVAERTKQLIQANEDLTKTNEELSRAYKELKTLDEAKDDFISHINHELRTPLNGILGYTSLLEEFDLDEESKSYLRSINSLVSRLVRVAEISLILTELKTVNHEIRLKPVLLSGLVEDVIRREDIESKNLNIELHNFDAPISVNANERLLAISLSFIMDNAIKYSPLNSTINLHTESKKDSAILKISDEGPGFSSTAKSKLFDLFTADNLEYSSHGFGMGLATAKRIIDLQGGKISIQNNRVGASVIVELPLAKKN